MADIRIVRRRLRDDDRAGAIEELAVGEELRALAADFLARGDDEHDAGAARELLREIHGRDDEGRDAALHVGRAAPIQPVTVDLARERVVCPGLGAERHDVDVAGEAQRRAAGLVRADRRDEARAPFGELVIGDRESRRGH